MHSAFLFLLSLSPLPSVSHTQRTEAGNLISHACVTGGFPFLMQFCFFKSFAVSSGASPVLSKQGFDNTGNAPKGYNKSFTPTHFPIIDDDLRLLRRDGGGSKAPHAANGGRRGGSRAKHEAMRRGYAAGTAFTRRALKLPVGSIPPALRATPLPPRGV